MKLKLRLYYMLFSVIMVSLFFPGTGWSQYFGKNKIQYEKHDWKQFKSEYLVIYFYDGGEIPAEFVAEAGDNAVEEYCRDFSHIMSDRIPVIVYNSHNEFEETNVISGVIPEQVGGFTEYFKQRVVIPFEGDYSELLHVIRHELVHAVMFDILFGNHFSGMFSAQVQLDIPLWFAEGLAEFESSGWTTRADMIIRDAVISGYLPEIAYLDMMPYQGGQSLLRYIATRYGHDKIGEILARIRVERNVEEGFKIAVGKDFEKISREWHLYERKEYWPEISQREEPEEIGIRLTNHLEWGNYYNTGPSISPDGSKIAFLTDRYGYADIYLYDVLEGKMDKRLIKGERSSSFEEMHWLRPGISWSPKEPYVAFAAKKGKEDALYIIDTVTGKVLKSITFGLDGVFSPVWSPDGDKIAFTGVSGGKSDIYVVNILDESCTPVNLTDDLFCESEPAWAWDGSGVFFISDRGGVLIDTEEDIESPLNRDVTGSDIYKIEVFGDDSIVSGSIERITNDKARERNLFTTPNQPWLIFVSDKSGIDNIYITSPADSSGEYTVYPATNVITGCYNPSMTSDGTLLAFSSFRYGGWDIYLMDNPTEIKPGKITVKNTVFRKSVSDRTPSGCTSTNTGKKQNTEKRGRKGTLIFDQKDARDDKEQTANSVENAKDYKLSFSPDLFYGSAAYDPYFGFLGYSRIALSDQLGNHRINFMLDMFSDLESSNFSIDYFYLPTRNDFSAGGYHNTFYSLSDDPDLVPGSGSDFFFIRDQLYGVRFMVSHPFSKFDRMDFFLNVSGIDRDYMDYWTGEIVGEETRDILLPSLYFIRDTVLWGMTGPMDGMRTMLGLEYSPGIGSEEHSLDFITFIGDVRKYWMLKRKYSFATRMFGGYSAGDSPADFYLGGMDNWLNYQLGPGAYITKIEEIYFSTFVTPLRGSRYYEQTGSKVFLTNLSFRFPMIDHLKLGWPLPLELYNVRGSLFLDIGAAWNNWSDFDPIDLTDSGLPRLKDAKAGCGIGMRLNLGIFVLMVDMAWPTDFISFPSPPVTYVTIGSEF